MDLRENSLKDHGFFPATKTTLKKTRENQHGKPGNRTNPTFFVGFTSTSTLVTSSLSGSTGATGSATWGSMGATGVAGAMGTSIWDQCGAMTIMLKAGTFFPPGNCWLGGVCEKR